MILKHTRRKSFSLFLVLTFNNLYVNTFFTQIFIDMTVIIPMKALKYDVNVIVKIIY